MRIAITGGIGVGKSEVLKVISKLGFVTVSADEINAKLLSDENYINKIAEYFPTVVENKKIDKDKLRNLIFNDDNERAKLNSIAHPAIRTEIEATLGNDVFVEIPLLKESGMRDMFDKVIVITAPVKIRIQRIVDRSNGQIDKIMAEKIIKSQINDNERLEDADFVIENKGSIEDIYTSITRILARLK